MLYFVRVHETTFEDASGIHIFSYENDPSFPSRCRLEEALRIGHDQVSPLHASLAMKILADIANHSPSDILDANGFSFNVARADESDTVFGHIHCKMNDGASATVEIMNRAILEYYIEIEARLAVEAVALPSP